MEYYVVIKMYILEVYVKVCSMTLGENLLKFGYMCVIFILEI